VERENPLVLLFCWMIQWSKDSLFSKITLIMKTLFCRLSEFAIFMRRINSLSCYFNEGELMEFFFNSVAILMGGNLE
jgi:hypothetical protein